MCLPLPFKSIYFSPLFLNGLANCHFLNSIWYDAQGTVVNLENKIEWMWVILVPTLQSILVSLCQMISLGLSLREGRWRLLKGVETG